MPYDFTTFYRPSVKEYPEAIQCTVTGNIPSWLKGSYISNGPGQMKYGKDEFKHVFDGSAILQKFTISETGVTYCSKFLQSNAYRLNSTTNQITVSEFGTRGTTEGKGLFQRFGEMFQFDKMFSDNALVDLVQYGGEYYASTESPFLHKINLDTLETLERVDLHKALGINSQCPHPHTLKDGSTVNVYSAIGVFGPKYTIMKFPPKPAKDKDSVFSSGERLASCDTRWKLYPCHMHTFGVSENHVVLIEQPLTVDVTAFVANAIREKPLIDGMDWLADKEVKLRVLSIETGKELKLKFKTDSFFYLHIINCYEEDNHIVLDLVTYESAKLLHNLKIETLKAKEKTLYQETDEGCNRRLILPLSPLENASPDLNLVTLPNQKAQAHRLKNGTIMLTPQLLTDVGHENPAVHPRCIGRRHNFFFGNSLKMNVNNGMPCKVSVPSGEVLEWAGPDGVYCVTHTFVPKPGAQAEDEGVVLVHCLHSDPTQSLLYVLDSCTMQELACASLTLDCDAPRGLHSIYVPAQ